MSAWIATLRATLAANRHAVLVTVAATRGSAPREAGARMLVTERGAQGTIGGGHLEFEALRLAREALQGGSAGAWLVRFPLAARLGQCCGGVATLLFQSFDAAAQHWLEALERRVDAGKASVLATAIARDAREPVLVAPGAAPQALPAAVLAAANELLERPDAPPRVVEQATGAWFVERVVANDFRVLVFGNGHVGRALIQVLGALPCAVTWVDAREEQFPAAVPQNVAIVTTDVAEAEARTAAPGSMFLVMTHSHALDFDLVAAILERDDCRYVGMIGSQAKRAQLERRLAERGFGQAAIARVTCPIGIAGIEGREPGAIAVAVAAELLQARARAAPESAHEAARRPRARGNPA
jgi:xanthine dehydrogenase accessory factor